MALADELRFKATATRMAGSKGRAVTLVKLAAFAGGLADYDPGEPIETEYSVNMVPLQYKQHERDGTLVQANDRKAMIEAVVEPRSQDRVVDGDTEYVIIRVEPIEAGSTTCAYMLQLRA